MRSTPSTRGKHADVVGVTLAAASALSYAVTIALGRSLAQGDLGVRTVLGARFTLAGLLVLVALALTGRSLVPPRGERLAVVLLGAVGYMVESSLFFLGLERGTAAAVTLLFYAYPTIVTLLEAVVGGPRPGAAAVVALVLSAVGTAVVVVTGGSVSITPAGIVLALGSAVAVAVYLVASDRSLRHTPPGTAAAGVALSCGLSFLAQGALLGELRSPAGQLPAMLANGLATASAFGFLFAALARLGPSRTSIVMTLEAVFAIALAAAFLDEGLRPLQLVGGALVLAATVLVAVSRPRQVAAEPPPTP